MASGAGEFRTPVLIGSLMLHRNRLSPLPDSNRCNRFCGPTANHSHKEACARLSGPSFYFQNVRSYFRLCIRINSRPSVMSYYYAFHEVNTAYIPLSVPSLIFSNLSSDRPSSIKGCGASRNRTGNRHF